MVTARIGLRTIAEVIFILVATVGLILYSFEEMQGSTLNLYTRMETTQSNDGDRLCIVPACNMSALPNMFMERDVPNTFSP